MSGFYGLDLYNLGASMRAVIDFSTTKTPSRGRGLRASATPASHRGPTSRRAMAALRLMPRLRAFARRARSRCSATCSRGRLDCLGAECDDWLDAAANARLVKDAEAYYRAMYHGVGGELESARHAHVRHALEILAAKGQDSKAVVWAHNSHIGNAAFTDMGMARGELNIGQLAKEAWATKARLIGFGTHSGTVAAADDWDEPMEVKRVRPSLPGQPRAAVPRQRRRRASCSTFARARADARPRPSWRSRGSSASSASSTGPKPSAGAIIARRSWPGSSTAGCGSTRPTR